MYLVKYILREAEKNTASSVLTLQFRGFITQEFGNDTASSARLSCSLVRKRDWRNLPTGPDVEQGLISTVSNYFSKM